MTTEEENTLIARHLLEYAKLMQVEAEKLELLGISTTPNLFDKAQEIFYLSEQMASKVKNIHQGLQRQL